MASSFCSFACQLMVSAVASGSVASRLCTLMPVIQAQLESVRTGAEAIATNLVSALFVMFVRIGMASARRPAWGTFRIVGGSRAAIPHRRPPKGIEPPVLFSSTKQTP
jgi:hypothetical protein